jgi:hypothetical protein
MYCHQCGQKLPDEANFCLRCGRPQRPDLTIPHESEPVWETCEIDWEQWKDHFFGGPEGVFWAEALGRDGRYRAATSAPFQAPQGPVTIGGNQRYVPLREAAQAALDAFIRHLLRGGWQPTGGRGDYWFSLRFRRRAS